MNHRGLTILFLCAALLVCTSTAMASTLSYVYSSSSFDEFELYEDSVDFSVVYGYPDSPESIEQISGVVSVELNAVGEFVQLNAFTTDWKDGLGNTLFTIDFVGLLGATDWAFAQYPTPGRSLEPGEFYLGYNGLLDYNVELTNDGQTDYVFDHYIEDQPGDNQYYFTFDPIEATAVPVPAGVWLLGSALAGLLGVRKKLS